MEYGGTLRIRNPKTLRQWIKRGWYQKNIEKGLIFNPCGRFREEKCECSKCRKSKNSPLMKIIQRFEILKANKEFVDGMTYKELDKLMSDFD